MVEALRKRVWAQRLTRLAVLLCFGSVAVALIAALGSGRGAWDFRAAFSVLRYAFFVAIAGALVALAAAWVARRVQPRLVLLDILAFVVAAAFLVYFGSQIRTARSVPPIHDITTNLEDRPVFYRLRVRDDNFDNIPDLDRPELAALEPQERWKAIHREHYADIATIRVPWSVAETVDRARALAVERGWEIVTTDRERGIVEAVDTSFFFRFKDNIVLRIRPDGDGSGALVDMRSISRVGVSDVGVNARRIRDFLADLQRPLPQ